MTETSPAVMMLDPEDAARKAGSAGKPVLHGDLKIVDADGKRWRRARPANCG